VTGVDLEVYVGDRLIQTTRKNDESRPRDQDPPADAPVAIVAKIPSVDPETTLAAAQDLVERQAGAISCLKVPAHPLS